MLKSWQCNFQLHTEYTRLLFKVRKLGFDYWLEKTNKYKIQRKQHCFFSFNHNTAKQSQLCHRLARSNAEVPSTLSPSGLDKQKVKKPHSLERNCRRQRFCHSHEKARELGRQSDLSTWAATSSKSRYITEKNFKTFPVIQHSAGLKVQLTC